MGGFKITISGMITNSIDLRTVNVLVFAAI